jgi:hypothetical protein
MLAYMSYMRVIVQSVDTTREAEMNAFVDEVATAIAKAPGLQSFAVGYGDGTAVTTTFWDTREQAEAGLQNHLSHILAKLGLESRTQLAAVLATRGVSGCGPAKNCLKTGCPSSSLEFEQSPQSACNASSALAAINFNGCPYFVDDDLPPL